MKTIVTLAVFTLIVLSAWAIHPVLGVVAAFLGYGAIDGLLSR